MSSLEDRIARLEAIEEIKALKAQYCAFCDAQYDPDGIAGQFVPEGVWDGGAMFGRHVGRAAIRAFFAGISGNIIFAAHLVMNPIIAITAPDRATGKWRLLMPFTAATESGPESRWLLSAYEDVYVRIDGQWLFESLAVEASFNAPHLKGWA